MYQLITESFLGLRRRGDRLHIAPCLPREWKTVTVRYRYGQTVYHIDIQPADVREETTILVDNQRQPSDYIGLVDDGQEHRVTARIASQELGSLVHR